MTVDVLSPTNAPAERRDILGSRVTALEWNAALAFLGQRLKDKRFTKVSFLNANNANIACREPDFAAALDDFVVLPDGLGVDLAARILYGGAFPANLNGTDFVPALLETETRPLKVGLIGTTRANAAAATGKLSSLAPQHEFIFIHDGFFTAEEEPAILERVRGLDILVVAMGVPRQELWIARHIGPEHCTMPIAVGALLDFLSGAIPRAPSWVRRLRMEWVYRLVLEPGRLWRRYVLGNPLFLARVVAQRIRRGRATG